MIRMLALNCISRPLQSISKYRTVPLSPGADLHPGQQNSCFASFVKGVAYTHLRKYLKSAMPLK